MNLRGKHIVITGPTAGIGQSSALSLAEAGARLTLMCRNPEKGQALADQIRDAGGTAPEIIKLDLADLGSVRSAASECLDLGRPVDILLNNAGVINTRRRVTVDGFEETLAVNHFAPFLLTGLLLPALLENRGSRIVNVASDAHSFVNSMGFDDMQAEKSYRTFREYGRSKGANILFTRSLAWRLADRPITVNCLHPGAVATSLGAQNEGMLARVIPMLLKPFFRSPEQGAETSIYLCQSSAVNDVTGAYFVNRKRARPKRWVRDEATAERLWQYTAECVGFDYPANP